MSSDTLRRAAALMRERAEAATPGPWEAQQDGSGGWWIEAPYTATIAELDIDYSVPQADAEHIAGMHPAVALAVADWLDTVARLMEHGDPGGPLLQKRALAVAHAYLGESA